MPVVTAAKVLLFGMMESVPTIAADRAVYDPQSAYAPLPFAARGSTAKHLAIVCNRKEATLLTGERDVQKAGSALLAKENAEVVVVKCGSHGAFVVANGAASRVPAYRTSKVWPIGSGDVFAAAFSWFWFSGKPAQESANNASKLTAYYCDTASLPVPIGDVEKLSYNEISVGPETKLRKRVYLAGPFFNIIQRWLINQARNGLLEQGHDVFSPFHDIGIGEAKVVALAL